MKLPLSPSGLFDPGHSGRRFGSSDVPVLELLVDVYGGLLDTARTMDWDAEGPRDHQAEASVIADIESRIAFSNRVLTLLRSTPEAWRP